jgi:diguanylate cyclase (GGDEF)-like protein
MRDSFSLFSTIVFIVSLLFFTFEINPLLSLSLATIIMIVSLYRQQQLHKEKTLLTHQLIDLNNRDIQYKKSIEKKNQEIQERYFIDALTKLPNRNALIDMLHEEIPSTLLLINIDAFKEINDFYSYQAGDSLIKQLSIKLSEIPLLFEHRLYHLHADEFAFLIHNRLSDEEIHFIVKEIEKMVQKHTFYASMNQSILFTLSFGIARSKKNSPYNKTLIKEAHQALHATKNHTETWSIYQDNLQETSHYEDNLYWLKKVKSAIEENRIEPYFQPIVNYKTGKIISYEALIRLVEKNGAALSPHLFLEIAKKSKLYTTLTKIMIEKSFKKFENSKQHFSINFSYEDMIDSEVLALLTEKLQNGNIGKRFCAEILESESISSYDLAKNFIDTIKTYGAKVAIDDFGSGYSNFERLFKLDIDYIKIDGSIIKDIDENIQLRIITETIVNFAKKTNIKVIAEYVHSKEIVDILAKMGVTKMQGYYFAEPSETIMITLKPDAVVE